MKPIQILSSACLVGVFLIAGCRGIMTNEEKSARQDLAKVGGPLHINLPVLTTNSTLRDAVYFSVQNNPQVISAYETWLASVENITIARSFPDPKLTFQAYIQDSLTSLMPGLVTDIPGYGKRSVRAAVATAESRMQYHQFAALVQQTAFDVKKSFYSLHFLDAKVNVKRQMLQLLAQSESVLRGQTEVGKTTIREVLKLQVEQKRLQTEITDLKDSRNVMLTQFKAALGLAPNQPNPPVPVVADFSDGGFDDEQFLTNALSQNPRLLELQAEIQLAESKIKVARKDKVPDFSVGIMAEVYEPPFFSPQAGMGLPIWRDKLAAERAAAEAGLRSAKARLTAGQISLTVEFAEQSYLIRESNRQLALLQNEVLPKTRQSLDIVVATYRSGQVNFSSVIDEERSLLEFQLDEIAFQSQREVARAQLALLVAGVPPVGAPLLESQSVSLHR